MKFEVYRKYATMLNEDSQVIEAESLEEAQAGLLDEMGLAVILLREDEKKE